MRLSRAVHERHALAFERLMSAFDRFEERFDRHEQAWDRHEEAWDRHEEAWGRHEQAFERMLGALDRHESQTDDLKIFIRDMNRRSEKVIQDLLEGNRAFCRELNAKTDGLLAEMKDVREESRAQREALLALIDRLPPASGGPRGA
jgi:chemotaxis regulatin CheY-phosphate phosphatase CheZ